ncbi:MAG: hypothetical protein AAF621_05785, partial [Pseudomonadota bacterium]
IFKYMKFINILIYTLILFLSLIQYSLSAYLEKPIQAEASEILKLRVAFTFDHTLDRDIDDQFCSMNNYLRRKAIDRLWQKSRALGSISDKIDALFHPTEHINFFLRSKHKAEHAAYKLGVLYAGGGCHTPDLKKAKHYLIQAAAIPESRFVYAMILLKEGQSFKTAYQLLTEAGNLGHGRAYYNAATLLYKKNVSDYAPRIISYLEQAAKNGYVRAFNDLGVFLLSDIGAGYRISFRDQRNDRLVKKYLNSAHQLIDYAASFNDKYGLFNRAAHLYTASCSPQTSVKIAQDLRKSATQKFTPALVLLQHMTGDKCMEVQAKLALQNIKNYFAPKESLANAASLRAEAIFQDALQEESSGSFYNIQGNPAHF